MAIFDELKSVASTLQEVGKIEQYKQILEVQKELLEMQKKIFDLEASNRSLSEQLEIKGKLIVDENVYYMETADFKKDGPFCTNCWDGSKKLVRLHSHKGSNRVNCPHCKDVVNPGQAQIVYPPRNYV